MQRFSAYLTILLCVLTGLFLIYGAGLIAFSLIDKMNGVTPFEWVDDIASVASKLIYTFIFLFCLCSFFLIGKATFVKYFKVSPDEYKTRLDTVRTRSIGALFLLAILVAAFGVAERMI